MVSETERKETGRLKKKRGGVEAFCLAFFRGLPKVLKDTVWPFLWFWFQLALKEERVKRK